MAPVDRTSQRIVKLVVSPFLLFLCLGPAVVGALIVFSATEYGGVLYRYAEPVYGQNDVVPGVDGIALVTIFVFAILVDALVLSGKRLRHGRAALEAGA